ncbi:hypothetical protein CVT26_011874 [Gymnopilus dilepis]|uniref:Uncharacterized protein n=1 Tax=Gymnopilus dilepis TaxID=231916 RepID=A0A409YH81_9AGAR|nr:hypothetical protein CVT26_011874 [Gymnopilus dilepis]
MKSVNIGAQMDVVHNPATVASCQRREEEPETVVAYCPLAWRARTKGEGGCHNQCGKMCIHQGSTLLERKAALKRQLYFQPGLPVSSQCTTDCSWVTGKFRQLPSCVGKLQNNPGRTTSQPGLCRLRKTDQLRSEDDGWAGCCTLSSVGLRHDGVKLGDEGLAERSSVGLQLTRETTTICYTSAPSPTLLDQRRCIKQTTEDDWRGMLRSAKGYRHITDLRRATTSDQNLEFRSCLPYILVYLDWIKKESQTDIEASSEVKNRNKAWGVKGLPFRNRKLLAELCHRSMVYAAQSGPGQAHVGHSTNQVFGLMMCDMV